MSAGLPSQPAEVSCEPLGAGPFGQAIAARALLSSFDNVPAAVAIFDRDMRYIAANRRWRTDYRLGDQELVGRSHYDVFPEIPDRWRDVHRRCLAGATESAQDEPFRRGDGAIDWVSWESRPWIDTDGSIGGLVLFTEVVNDRKHAELLDERYRALAQHSRDIMLFVRHSDGRIVEANAAASAAYGYTPAEMVGLTIQDLRAPGTQALTSVQMAEAESVGGLFETMHRRRDGSEFPVEVNSSGAMIGGVRVLVSVVRDITRRRDAAGLLAASEMRYRNLAHFSPDAVVVSRDGIVEYVNPAAAALLGARHVNELLGRPVPELIHPEYREVVHAARERVIAGESSTRIEAKIVSLDGSVRDVEITGSAFRDDRGVAAQAVLRDITDRKRLEFTQRDMERREVLSHGEARFRALIEHSADMLVVVDRDAAVTFWSPGSAVVLGWTESETLGRPAPDFVHPDDAANAGGAFAELAKLPGATQRMLLRLRHRNGTWRLVESVASNLLDDPDVRGIVLNSRDVTEERELQQRSLEEQKLESIGRLAGGVAHDFNNLLTAILGGVEALDDALGRGVPVQREDVDAIHEAGDRARDLTRQLLSFARRQVIAPVPLDLNLLVRDTEKLLRRLLPENVTIATDLHHGVGMVLGDVAQLQQVILNLSVNARDAMPGGGTLAISTRTSAFDAAAASAAGLPGPCTCVRLVIRDNGVGMDDEVRTHLFEPFFTTKPQGQGTGLGLAAAYGVVAQNHGRILVQSEKGRGTTIAIDLPTTTRLAERLDEPEPSSAGGSETVLLVEDEPLVRDIMARALGKAGYRVLVAGDAHEALAVARAGAGRIDLLVTDVVMPGLSGPDLAEEMLARHPGLRVLFVSGYTQDAIGCDGVLQANVEFLQKPFRMGALLARVRSVLESSGARRG
jgi:PAS domain S-box-containing protein